MPSRRSPDWQSGHSLSISRTLLTVTLLATFPRRERDVINQAYIQNELR